MMTSNERKRERIKNNVCVCCGNDVDDGCIKCKTCRDRHNQSRRERKASWKNEGKCRRCGKPRMSSRVLLCEEHYLKDACAYAIGTEKHWKMLKTIWNDQNGRCVYTNEVLCMGVNASIDHILPISKYPELKNDINNIQWVSRQMNVVKNDLTESEMVELFKTVISNIERQESFPRGHRGRACWRCHRWMNQ